MAADLEDTEEQECGRGSVPEGHGHGWKELRESLEVEDCKCQLVEESHAEE